MVPIVPLLGGSILPLVLPVVLGILLAVLAGTSVASAERRSLIPAAVRQEQRRLREQHRRHVPAMAKAA